MLEKQSFKCSYLQKSTTLPSAHVFALVAVSLLLPQCLPSNLSSFFHNAPLNALGHEKATVYKKTQSFQKACSANFMVKHLRISCMLPRLPTGT